MQDTIDKEPLKKLYVELIQTLVERHEDYSENKLAIFSAIAGNAYKKGGVMVVGRAVNGWEYNLDPTNSQSVMNCLSAIDAGVEKDSLCWVKDLWGTNQTGEKGRYSTKKSAFWRLTREIVASNGTVTDDFANSIVWSNLYKAAKYKSDTEEGDQAKGGNPSTRLRKVEVDLCQKILDTEIDTYRPATIVFLTGLWWACTFLETANDRKGPFNKFVEQTGVYRDINYVVGPHPQGKKESLYLEEISRYLK